MGQGTSQPSIQSNTQFTSNSDILKSFNQRCLEQFTATELVSFKNKLGKDLDEKISNEELTKLLYISEDARLLRELLYNFVQVFGNFPLIKNSYESVTGIGILKAIILTNPERCKKYVKVKHYDQLKLWFIALSLCKTIKEDPNMSSSSSSEETFDVIRILKTFDGLNIDELNVPSAYMVQFISWLLVLTNYCPTNNCKLANIPMFGHWNSYTKAADTIIRSMGATDESSYIEYHPFSHVMRSVVPHIFDPLPRIMEHLLFTDDELVDPHLGKVDEITNSSRLLNEAVLAQLSATLPKQLVISHLQKLYLGRDHGFSMRSFQYKVFKWNAPTILLLRGRIISDDDEYSIKNARYEKFLHEYPKLKSSDMNTEVEKMYHTKSKVILAVYVSEPWKITNKEYFGGSQTTIIQLSPFQEILKSFHADVLYFNTIGGGIGVGNKQPVIKPTTRSYSPGNVSLTMDSALEFAVLRHIGQGGVFEPGVIVGDKEFEVKLLLQDVEVWGCGGKKQLEEQLKEWEWEETEAKRRQQINLRSAGEDRALLEMAGLIGQGQSGGSI